MVKTVSSRPAWTTKRDLVLKKKKDNKKQNKTKQKITKNKKEKTNIVASTGLVKTSKDSNQLWAKHYNLYF